MLTVTAKRDETGIVSVSAEGHTGFADAGSDIVCAAVSALMQALWVGLEDVLKLKCLDISSDPDIPSMRFTWDSAVVSAQIVARTVVLSIKAIADEYPEHVNVIEVFDKEEESND